MLDSPTLNALWMIVVFVTPIIGGTIAYRLRKQETALESLDNSVDIRLEQCRKEWLDAGNKRQAAHEDTVQRLARLEASHTNLCNSLSRIETKVDALLITKRGS